MGRGPGNAFLSVVFVRLGQAEPVSAIVLKYCLDAIGPLGRLRNKLHPFGLHFFISSAAVVRVEDSGA